MEYTYFLFYTGSYELKINVSAFMQRVIIQKFSFVFLFLGVWGFFIFWFENVIIANISC